MPTAIADLFINVSADVSAAQSGLTSLGNQLNQTQRQFQAAAPAALALSAAGAAVATGFGAAVNVAASFEQAMANVRAVMTPAEARTFGAALSDLAVRLGQDTVFSAREAAAGIGELVKAGIPAQAILEGAGRSALDLAAATGIPVAEAATLAATSMNVFHQSAQQLGGVVDFLAGTVNASAADMSDLRFGLQSVGAVAAQAGLSFQDTATALGLFANNGLRGQDAGTSLKTMLTNLQPSTKAQTKEFQRLGLMTATGANAFFDARGNAKGLADIAGTLQNALRGMTKQQQLASLEILFGTDAMRAAAILASEGAGGFRELTGAISGISAADTQAIRLGTLQGALSNLGSSFETVQIIIGNLFLPVLTDITRQVRSVVDRFSDLSPEMQRAIVFFGGLGGAVAAVVGGIALLSPIIISVGPAFVALGGLLAGIAPILLGLAAVAAVLAAAWQADLGGIQGIVANAFEQLPTLMDNVTSAFARAGEFWQASIVPTVSTIATALATRLQPSAERVATTFSTRLVPSFQTIATRLGPLIDRIFNGLATLWETRLLPAAERLGSFIVDTLIPGFVDLAALGLERAIQLGDELGTVWDTQLSPALQAVGSFIAAEVTPRFQAFAENAIPAVIAASQSLQAFWETRLGPAAEAIGNFIAQNIGPAFDTFGTALRTVQDAGRGVLDFFAPFAEQLGAVAANIGPGLVDFFQNQLPAAFAAFSTQAASVGPFIQSVSHFFEALFNVMTALGTVAGTALQGLFQNVLVPGFQELGAALTPIQPALTAAGDALTTTATGLGLIGDRLQPVTDFFNNLAAAINGAATAIRGFQLPSFLQPGTGSVFGAPGGAGPQVLPAAFTPGGGGVGGGNVINITVNSGPITGEADEQSLAERIAAAINGSARRVAPPVPAGQPGLVSGVL